MSANASWQRLAGERSNTLVGFGLLTLDGALSFVVAGPKPGQALTDRLHRQLRAYAVNAGTPATAVALPVRNIDLPFADELALAACDQKLVLAIVQNFDHPGMAGGFAGTGWTGVRGAPSLASVDLGPAQSAVVTAPLPWSALKIPCEKWLFDPRIHGASGALALTFGTADGQTALFEYVPSSSAPPRPLGVIPRAVNAVLLPAPAGLLVLHRIPDASWSGYADSQYAWTRGAVALALRVATVDAGGNVVAPAGPVDGVGDGPIYAFDATLADDGSLLLALVRGPARWPSVTVVRVAKGGGTSSLAPLALGASPVAVRLRPTARGVALATFTREGFDRRIDLYHCSQPFP